MRSATATMVVLIIAMAACAIPVTRSFSPRTAAFNDSGYIMVGGQNGTWFQGGQFPRLDQISLQNDSSVRLDPVRSGGTVWGGGFNGLQFLVSGWGSDDNSFGPYIWLYNGAQVVTEGSLDEYGQASSWSGGDIFAASYNGKEWLLSGLGSGNLTSYGASNHMSLALFNGSNFTDLSSMVPNQRDAILYTNAWNGQYWLIGGGYQTDGALLNFNGTKIVNLTVAITQAVPTFGSVQSLAWNGYYWLIGGVNFLATYDGHRFADLTPKLDSALQLNGGCCSSVNAIAWDGAEWVLGGGKPVAQLGVSHAWLVKYASGGFTDLTSKIASTEPEALSDSSILSIAMAGGSWIIGGYSNGRGSLYEYTGTFFTNLSNLVTSYTYVNWVGAYSVQEHTPEIARPTSIGPFESGVLLLTSEGLILEMIRP